MKSQFVPILAAILFAAAALCATGCGKTNSVCPDGATLAGAAPPQGLEQWCQKKLETGQIVYHGPYTSWYRGGQKAVQAYYKNGYLDGSYALSYENGRTEKQGEYVNGREEGIWTFRYENGQIKMMGPYKNGQPHGEWSFFDQADNLSKIRYDSGKMVE